MVENIEIPIGADADFGWHHMAFKRV